jgi:hypothetical protein
VTPVLAGLALAAAILMKLFALEALAPALWIMLGGWPVTRRAALAALTFLGAVTIPVVLDFVLVYPAQQWDQVIRLHERAAQVHLPDLTPPFQVLRQFFTLDLGLTVLALAGLAAFLILRRWRELGFLLLWVVGSVIMLLAFRPLFAHHPPILLTGMGVCAGVALGSARNALRDRRVIGVVLVSGLAYLTLLPRLAHDDRHVLYGGLSPRIANLSAYVQAHSALADFVATDDLAVADSAHRLVPPPLCDPSNVRLRAGYLTAHDLISSTKQYRATLVLPSFGIYQQVPGYKTWVRQHFTPERAPDGVTAYLQLRPVAGGSNLLTYPR